ncbi:MAG: TrbC/VirB2 family protein [Methylococcales bacterium]|jgi:type IV secretion system protein VirB2|nr:TrbC/VirB2 family protein [Methylococcales bacterium]
MKFNSRKLLSVLAVVSVALIPEIALAAAPWENTATNIQKELVTLGGIVGVIAVIVSGFMAWFGKMTWGRVAQIAGGFVLVLGAAAIVEFFKTAVA